MPTVLKGARDDEGVKGTILSNSAMNTKFECGVTVTQGFSWG